MRLQILHEDDSKGWIAVDLDGTMAKYDHFKGHDHIGPPVQKMVKRVKRWLNDGENVKTPSKSILRFSPSFISRNVGCKAAKDSRPACREISVVPNFLSSMIMVIVNMIVTQGIRVNFPRFERLRIQVRLFCLAW